MGRNRVPSYRLHKPSGQGVVTLGGRDHYLGPHGSEQSKAEYKRVIGEFFAAGAVAPKNDHERGLIVDDLIDRYTDHAERHYVKGGEPTSEVGLVENALGWLHEAYGHVEADTITPLALKAVRDAMVRAKRPIREAKPKKKKRAKKGAPISEPSAAVVVEPQKVEPEPPKPLYTRGTINLHVGRIRRMFRWAAENGFITPSTYHGLIAIRGLQRGRSEAREPEPVKPVPDAWVDATLPRVSRQVAAMIELQRLSGMRPGEVVTMRASDLDTSGETWTYRPASHKTEHHGKGRSIVLGPKAQEIVRGFLKPDLGAYLFSPKDADAERRARLHAERVTPMTPSQEARRPTAKPKKAPGKHYSTESYARAITVACMAREEPKPPSKLPARTAIPHWAPNQLRHLAATRLRSLYGIETTRVILGHSSVNTSEIYAEADHTKAHAAMAKIG